MRSTRSDQVIAQAREVVSAFAYHPEDGSITVTFSARCDLADLLIQAVCGSGVTPARPARAPLHPIPAPRQQP